MRVKRGEGAISLLVVVQVVENIDRQSHHVIQSLVRTGPRVEIVVVVHLVGQSLVLLQLVLLVLLVLVQEVGPEVQDHPVLRLVYFEYLLWPDFQQLVNVLELFLELLFHVLVELIRDLAFLLTLVEVDLLHCLLGVPLSGPYRVIRFLLHLGLSREGLPILYILDLVLLEVLDVEQTVLLDQLVDQFHLVDLSLGVMPRVEQEVVAAVLPRDVLALPVFRDGRCLHLLQVLEVTDVHVL